MAQATLNWLLVGAGDIAHKRVAPALATAPGSALLGVCDPRPEAAREVAAQHQAAEVYADFAEALARTRADAVYLATPIHLHAAHALQALRAGKHVLVEKPLALSAPEGEQVVKAAAASGTTAGCAYFRRLSPRYQYARDMLARGEFGRLVLARLVYHSWFSPSPDDPKYWRVVRARSGGGPLSDMGSHMFDVLIGLCGLPASVYARCDNLVQKWDVEDTASVLLTMPDGAHVTASFSWSSKTWRHEFEMVGTEAKLNWLPYDSGPVTATRGRQIEQLDQPSAENVHQPLVEDFVEAVRAGRPPACPLAEAVKTNVLLDAIYQSAAERREITLTA
jgi:1,5-anhydro-D-fructose reductase (1,5-anhydro-D-mannitol-forming)